VNGGRAVRKGGFYVDNVEYIKSKLPKTELLLTLDEEATELSQAALKLRRVLDGLS